MKITDTISAIHGHISDVKKIRTRQVCAILIEVPIEQYAAVVAGFDEKDVLITIAPTGIGSYGVLSNAPTEEKPVKTKGGELAKLAGRLCESETFRRWLIGKTGSLMSAEGAAIYMRKKCGIGSRSELDHNENAAAVFHDEFRRPYMLWQEQHA